MTKEADPIETDLADDLAQKIHGAIQSTLHSCPKGVNLRYIIIAAVSANLAGLIKVQKDTKLLESLTRMINFYLKEDNLEIHNIKPAEPKPQSILVTPAKQVVN